MPADKAIEHDRSADDQASDAGSTSAAAAQVDLSNWAAHYSINPAAVEAFQSMLARTLVAPGIDLERIVPPEWVSEQVGGQFNEISCGQAWRMGFNECRSRTQLLIDQALGFPERINASPKGGSKPASRIELTNGQIAQLADFAGTPVAGAPLDEQDVLVIQHADAGHSGPGLYAHYDELPEEGAIYLDGQLSDSPKGGSDGERLDFVLLHMAWVREKKADSGASTFWLETQDEDENFVRLSGPDFFRTPREAIDAAMQATSAEVGHG